MDRRLQDAYSPDSFRKSAHAVVDLLADHLEVCNSGRLEQALPWMEPEQAMEHWGEIAEQGVSIEQLCREVLARSVRINHPRFLGHQICPPAPTAMIASLITACVNNGSGIYEMGMAGTAMERCVIQTVARKFEMPTTADGFLTSGGTLANLTALLAARSIRGAGESQPLALLVSDQSHYCIERAVQIMGWGSEGIVKVPTNERFQMRTDALANAFETTTNAGRKVIAVVGSACTTSTGSFDDLSAIGSFCREHKLWFHVDGAHGAAVAFSPRHRHLLKGIAEADSVVLDFHKMLMSPAITSGLVFRRGEDGFRTFAVEADYLFSRQTDHDWFNLAKRTFECTKTMMATSVFSILAAHGEELLAANIERLHHLTAAFVILLRERKAFELAVEPQTNIVCFRYRGSHPDREWDALNARIRTELTREGRYYIVQTSLGGRTWLRVTITNPHTTEVELSGVLDAVTDLAEANVDR